MTGKRSLVAEYLGLAIIAAAIVYLRLHSLGEPLERDLTSYSYFAHQMLSGVELYSYLFDHHPPGVYWVYMAAELIWGYGPEAITYLGIFFTLVSLIFLYLFVKEITNRWCALAGAVFWALTSNAFLLQANQPNTELFMNSFFVLSLWALARRLQSGHVGFLAIAGLSFGVAAAFKTVALFPFLAVALYMIYFDWRSGRDGWIKDGLRDLLWLSVPAALVWAAIFLYFAALGRFYDFWGAVFTFNLSYSESILSNLWRFFSTPLLYSNPVLRELLATGLLSLLWLFFSRKEYGRVRRPLFIILFISLILELSSPGKFWMHYYQLFLPLFSILSALFLFDIYGLLLRKVAGSKAIRGVAIAAVMVPAIGFILYDQITFLRMGLNEMSIAKYGPLFVQSKMMGEFIRDKTAPCETIYEWGKDNGIYFYSQRDAAAGIIFIDILFMGSREEQDERRREVRDAVLASPPAFLIYNSAIRWVDDDIFDDLLNDQYVYRGRRYMRYVLYERKERVECQ